MLVKHLILFLLVFSLLGCLTLEQRYTNTANDVVRFINGGKAEELTAITQTPFLLDGEIILLREDVAEFWKGILEAGFQIERPILIDTFETDKETFQKFARTMEVESYFEKYVTKNGHVVVVETEIFQLFLVMDSTKQGKTKIIGFKGPVEP